MKKRGFGKSKRGISLVEEICAVCILAIGVFACVAAIGTARLSVISDGSQDAAAAQAQELADDLVSALSQQSAVPSAINTAAPQPVTVGKETAANVGSESGFSAPDAPKGPKRFCAEPVTDADGNTEGYNIVCRVYYNGGKDFIQMKAYASARGDKSP